jgi:hypothetical protein
MVPVGLLITRILSALLGLAFVVLTFVFVSFLVALAVAAALVAAAWLWWRGRGRVQTIVVRRSGSRVIEGEYRIIEK